MLSYRLDEHGKTIKNRSATLNEEEMKIHFLTTLLALIISNSIFAQTWQTDFKKTKTIAQKENKTIILVFQGSDWCAPCIKLHRQIWDSEEFKAYAKEHFILHKADFPRKKKNKLSTGLETANKKLAEHYNPKGFFPHVVVMDKNGKVLGETGYKKISPSEYIKLLTAFTN